jgi:hypothetical protein
MAHVGIGSGWCEKPSRYQPDDLTVDPGKEFLIVERALNTQCLMMTAPLSLGVGVADFNTLTSLISCAFTPTRLFSEIPHRSTY